MMKSNLSQKSNPTEVIPTKILEHVERVEVGEDGATLVMAGGKRFYFNRDQVAQTWGTLTLALDAATMFQLSAKVKRLGLGACVQDALRGAKMVLEDERQLALEGVNQ